MLWNRPLLITLLMRTIAGVGASGEPAEPEQAKEHTPVLYYRSSPWRGRPLLCAECQPSWSLFVLQLMGPALRMSPKRPTELARPACRESCCLAYVPSNSVPNGT